MGSGGGGSQNWQQQAYNNAYAAAQAGQPLDMAISNQPNYADATRMAYEDWGKSGAFSVDSMMGPIMEMQRQYQEQQAAAQKAYEEEQERLRVEQGKADASTTYGNYLTAAESASTYILSQIAEEQSNAQLMGVDYEMNEEMQNQRISDYFATLWSEADQQKVEKLINEFGEPEGFDGYSVIRGNADNVKPNEEAKETPVSASEGIRLVEEEEDNLRKPLGTSITLGV
jgi:hypothetical protein